MRFPLFFILLFACLRAEPSVSVKSPSSVNEVAAIAKLRADSNAAIAAHDVARLVSFIEEDFQITTGAGVALSGRKAMAARFAEQFTKFPDTIYVRSPELIEISSTAPLASERGRWVGRWTENGKPVEFRGTYQAMWRLTDGHWLIRSELFVTLEKIESAK